MDFKKNFFDKYAIDKKISVFFCNCNFAHFIVLKNKKINRRTRKNNQRNDSNKTLRSRRICGGVGEYYLFQLSSHFLFFLRSNHSYLERK